VAVSICSCKHVISLTHPVTYWTVIFVCYVTCTRGSSFWFVQERTTASLLQAALRLFLRITVASELKKFSFFVLLMFCFHTLSLLPHVCLVVFLLSIFIQ